MRRLGGSFGAGAPAKLIAQPPSGWERAFPWVSRAFKPLCPGGGRYAGAPDSVPVGLQSPPCRASVPLPITEAALDADTLKTAKMSFDCVKTKMGLPGSVGPSGRSAVPLPGAGREARPAYPTRKVSLQAEVILPTAPPGCWQTGAISTP